jgi:histidine triad (HIT) family protein
MSDCLFCKIAANELDSESVYESSDVLAFRDINPAAPTHILVIPKKHVASAAELSDADGPVLAEIFTTIAKLATEGGVDSYRVVTNVGADAGQTVHHLHFHLIGGRSMSWPPG